MSLQSEASSSSPPHSTPIPRLIELFGLSEGDLQDIVMQGFLARTGCSPHHPKTYPGLTHWAETVRALRDKTVPLGWGIRDVNNFPLSVHPNKKITIAVQTGDRDTGVSSGSPSNRAAKGTTTEEAVAVNQRQLELFEFDAIPELLSDDDKVDSIMWVLLYHVDVANREIRFELSLPLKMIGGKIRSWKERFVFASMPFDQDINIGDENEISTDFNIPVERRE